MTACLTHCAKRRREAVAGAPPRTSQREQVSIVASVVNLVTELAVGKPLAAVSGSASFANRTSSRLLEERAVRKALGAASTEGLAGEPEPG